MGTLNIFPLLWPIVTANFTTAQQTTLGQYLTRVNRKDDFTKGQVVEIFNMIDGSTTTQEFLDVIEVCKRLAFGEAPKMFYVNNGEDFSLQIDLEAGRDFTGYLLTMRLAVDLTLLSANNIAGDSYANAPIQYVTVSDLSLAAGNFYKCVALLEHPNVSDQASGDAATNLTDVILIVGTTIDL
jgi:hypothetical protein